MVKNHGFTGLEHVNKHYLKENVDLLYNATDKDGVAGLYQYLVYNLKPLVSDATETIELKKELRKTFIKDRRIAKYLNNDFFTVNKMNDVFEKDL